MAQKKIFTQLNLQGNVIKNVGAPVDNTDVATKASAQAQADAAKTAAEATATSLASAAQAAAISAAAADATTKASAAVTTANAYTDTSVANLVAAAPETLNTLKELALALGNDENFSTTITTSIGTKTGKFATNITGSGPAVGNDVEYEITHSLNKADIVVQAFEGNDSVDVFVRKVDNNSLKIITGAALGSTVLRVVVVG